MRAEIVEESRQLCLLTPEKMTVDATGAAICVAACEQAGVNEGCVTQNELRKLSAQLLTIQEKERQRIANDLHDGLGQSLALIKLALDDITHLLRENALNDAEAALRRLRSKVQATSGELRRIAMDLRPSMLDDLGILSTLSWFFREFESTCRGIKVEKHLLVEEHNIPSPLKLTIFRILQEAVCNIVKHAEADRIQVSLLQDGDLLHLTIEDNGKGFDQTVQDNYCPLDKSLGLVSMNERAKFSGGTYRIESVHGQGTRISVSWPCT